MTKDELIRRFRKWRDDDENEKIIAAVIALPESAVDAEILSWLAQSYIDIEEYKRAIAVLENLHDSMENDYKWQFMMGLALLRVSDDDECYDDDELRRNILERAKVCLARGMNMNPPEDVLESADRFMEEIEVQLDELNGSDDDDFRDDDLEMYEDEELDVLEDHIKDNYGDFPTVFHETVSKDIIVDIACIPPTEERNYYTLVTMGMGAHIMNTPDALPPEENGRAELLICLPPDWKLGESSEEWFWPIALLKDLARLPINTDSWLGWGHSVDHRTSFSESAGFCGTLLLFPENVSEGAESCVLPNGDKVNFFEVIPLYREEMVYKINHDTKSLLERLNNVSHIVDINRPNYCEDTEVSQWRVFDSANSHSKKIDQKGLKIDKINGCNHIAIFMRWCIEHDLIAQEFYEHCPDIVKGVKDGTKTDIREFFEEYFNGCLEPYQLSYLGACFADYYYNYEIDEPEHFYPSDVDDYAEHYFGTERYNSEEFQDEAYMFVPFDEEYYQGMSQYINRAFSDFLPDFARFRENEDKDTVSLAEKELGIKLVIPKYNEFVKTFRNTAYMAKASGQCAVPMIIDECGALSSNESIEELLQDAADPFRATAAIASFSEDDPVKWAEKNLSGGKFSVISPTERMLSLQNVLKNIFGANPVLFTFGEKDSSLLLPLENGVYIRFVK